MNKITPLFFVCILTCLSVCGQQSTYKIDYTFFVSEEIKNVDPETETDPIKKDIAMVALLAALFAEDGEPILELWTNKDFLRVESRGPLENKIQITHKQIGESYTLYPAVEQYTISPDISDKVLALGSEMYLASEMPITFVPDKSKSIAGQICKLAQIHFDQAAAHIDIWYSEEIPAAYWGDYPYLKELPGAALEIVTHGIGIQARAVTETEDNADIFTVPLHYSLIEASSAYSDWGSSNELGLDRYTYVDEATNLVGMRDGAQSSITAAKYTLIMPFENEYAIAIDDHHLYGVLNSKGEEIIPFEYEYLQYDAESNVFQFDEGGIYGLLNVEGKVIVPAKYDYISAFSGGKATFQANRKYGILQSSGSEAVPATHEAILEVQHTHFIAMNENNDVALYTITDNKRISNFYDFIDSSGKEGLYMAVQGELYGFINAEGQIVIPFRYSSATKFVNNVAEVVDTSTNTTHWINSKGETVEAPH